MMWLFFSFLQNSVTEQLKSRYDRNQIYTYVGDILIAVNPFHKMDIYTPQVCGFDASIWELHFCSLCTVPQLAASHLASPTLHTLIQYTDPVFLLLSYFTGFIYPSISMFYFTCHSPAHCFLWSTIFGHYYRQFSWCVTVVKFSI